jgi:hypothetical protein
LKAILYIALLVLPIFSFGQNVKFKLEIGPRWLNYNPEQFNSYLNTYNAYMQTIGVNATQPYAELSSTVVRPMGLGFGICYSEPGMAYVNVHFSSSNFQQESNYRRSEATQYGRDFVFRTNSKLYLLESGYCFDNGFVLGGGLSILLNNYRVEVWQVYTDGSRSLGKEYYTNGYYSNSNSLIGLNAFSEINIYKNMVKLNFRAVYHWNFVAALIGDDPTSGSRMTNWYANDPLIGMLPLDYGRFVNAVNTYDINELSNNSSYVNIEKLTRFTIFAGLVFDIPLTINRKKYGKK